MCQWSYLGAELVIVSLDLVQSSLRPGGGLWPTLPLTHLVLISMLELVITIRRRRSRRWP